jgi:hypothetical protein
MTQYPFGNQTCPAADSLQIKQLALLAMDSAARAIPFAGKGAYY